MRKAHVAGAGVELRGYGWAVWACSCAPLPTRADVQRGAGHADCMDEHLWPEDCRDRGAGHAVAGALVLRGDS